MKLLIKFFICIVFSQGLSAGVLENDKSFNFISKTLAAHAALKNLYGLNSKEKKSLFDIGIILNASTTKEIKDNIPKSISDLRISQSLLKKDLISIPMFAANINYPERLSFQSQFIPSIKLSDLNLTYYAFGSEWTYLQNYHRKGFLTTSVKFYYNSLKILAEKNQLKQKAYGLLHNISTRFKNFIFLFGYGYNSNAMSINVDHNNIIFNEIYQNSGLQISFSSIFYYKLFNIGIEWSSINSIKIYSAKIGIFL